MGWQYFWQISIFKFHFLHSHWPQSFHRSPKNQLLFWGLQWDQIKISVGDYFCRKFHLTVDKSVFSNSYFLTLPASLFLQQSKSTAFPWKRIFKNYIVTFFWVRIFKSWKWKKLLSIFRDLCIRIHVSTKQSAWWFPTGCQTTNFYLKKQWGKKASLLSSPSESW